RLRASFFTSLTAGLKACSTLCLENELFKHLIREQAPARGQTYCAGATIQQAVGDQLINNRDKPFDLGAEALPNFMQVDTAIEPQSQKETLLQRLPFGDRRGFGFRRHKELIERIRCRKPQALDSLSARARRRRQHGMGVDAEAEIGPARPVFEVV